jgi:hypothetical protein
MQATEQALRVPPDFPTLGSLRADVELLHGWVGAELFHIWRRKDAGRGRGDRGRKRGRGGGWEGGPRPRPRASLTPADPVTCTGHHSAKRKTKEEEEDLTCGSHMTVVGEKGRDSKTGVKWLFYPSTSHR